MAYNYEYPYVDPGMYNDDWLLEKMKQLATEWEAMQVKFTTLEEYVKNYFANLDVQDEINNKIDDMISSGQFTELLKQATYPYIASGKYNHKKVLWFIDSLGSATYAPKPYPVIIAEATGMELTLDAVGSAGFIAGLSINSYSARINNYVNKQPEQYAYVFLSMSANDSPYISTLRSQIASTVELAKSVFINATVILVDIFFNNTSKGNINWWDLHYTYQAYMWNGAKCNGISYAYNTIYDGFFSNDGVHPNQNGHNWIANLFLSNDRTALSGSTIDADFGWYVLRDNIIFIGLNANISGTITLDFLTQLEYSGILYGISTGNQELYANDGWTLSISGTPVNRSTYCSIPVNFIA